MIRYWQKSLEKVVEIELIKEEKKSFTSLVNSVTDLIKLLSSIGFNMLKKRFIKSDLHVYIWTPPGYLNQGNNIIINVVVKCNIKKVFF